MTDSVLVIGGTRFIGRHTVEEFLSNDYEVTIFNRGNHENPFAENSRVEHVEGNRREKPDLQTARAAVDPDIVIDCVAYYPEDVREAVTIFADVDAYVYISSGSAYNYVSSETAGIFSTSRCARTRRRSISVPQNKRLMTRWRPTAHGRPKATARSSKRPMAG